MSRSIDFYFDFLSPYAYLAHAKLPQLAAQYGCELIYRPIDLQSVKLAAGNTGPSTREMPVKHRHLRVDLRRWADFYGVAFTPPAGYGSQRLNCGAFYAADHHVTKRYVEVAWGLVWGQGGDMNDDGLLCAVADAMKWDRNEFLIFAGSKTALARLQESTAHAHERGVFGVPSMFVGEHMWWGNDRLHFLEQQLAEMNTCQ
jgi:2-hydroxychromene-2-carboxylate isomerase